MQNGLLITIAGLATIAGILYPIFADFTLKMSACFIHPPLQTKNCFTNRKGLPSNVQEHGLGNITGPIGEVSG